MWFCQHDVSMRGVSYHGKTVVFIRVLDVHMSHQSICHELPTLESELTQHECMYSISNANEDLFFKFVQDASHRVNRVSANIQVWYNLVTYNKVE